MVCLTHRSFAFAWRGGRLVLGFGHDFGRIHSDSLEFWGGVSPGSGLLGLRSFGSTSFPMASTHHPSMAELHPGRSVQGNHIRADLSPEPKPIRPDASP